MKPASWAEAVLGICCLLVPLWLVPELVSSFFYLDKPFEYRSFDSIIGYAGLLSGFLLIGSIGISLLTGKYHEHRVTFRRIWLVVGIFAVVTILWSWMAVSTAQ